MQENVIQVHDGYEKTDITSISYGHLTLLGNVLLISR